MNESMSELSKKIVELFADYGWNPGEFEELIYRLANGGGIWDVEVEDYGDRLRYMIYLNRKGVEIADEWAEENNCSYCCYKDYVTLTGCRAVIEYDDELLDSVENTRVILGLEKPEENF